MMIVLLILLATILPAFAGTLPARGQHPSHHRRFSLHISPKPHAKRNFVRDWAAAHQKWGGADVLVNITSSFFSLAEDDGELDVEPLASDGIYVADVNIGTPPQQVKMTIDTGSADLWVQSTDTVYQFNSDGPWAPRYSPSNSSTAQAVRNATWSVGYADGSSASGIVYRDTIRLGNFQFGNTSIESAQYIAPKFEFDTGLSGIIGLAKNLSSSITPPTAPFINTLKQQLTYPFFTVDLRNNSASRFDFGYVDDSLAAEPITWLDTVPTSPHWDVTLDLTAWDSSSGVENDSPTGDGDSVWWYDPFTATVDTGTTLLFLPDALASKYWNAIPGMQVEPQLSNAFTYPCNGSQDLPALHFKLPGSGNVLTVPGPYLDYGPVDGYGEICWGGMQSAAGMDTTILGDVMLKAVFVAFDMENNRVGFANKNLTM